MFTLRLWTKNFKHAYLGCLQSESGRVSGLLKLNKGLDGMNHDLDPSWGFC